MRVYLGKDIVCAGVTRFAITYLNLKSLEEKKAELKKLSLTLFIYKIRCIPKKEQDFFKTLE
jgi:uncharacterized protein YsxB (DUF464 family)